MSLFQHMDLSQLQAVERYMIKGLEAWRVDEPMTLDEWATTHFYLSAESSYVEQDWTPWPFQRAIMACISNDDIAEVVLRKSARVGYTKMLLAAIGYFAQHKRRNQCIWQPTDDDAEDFVKSELDPMLRDIDALHKVFPAYLRRHKDNTLQQKRFLGSTLRSKGGKAAKNYRRISVDVGYMDELSAFDRDVEKEGDPRTLAKKRLEGSTFPKLVLGSTPKQKGFCLIEDAFVACDERFTYRVPCPHCQRLHEITWGGKDEPHGFKWAAGDALSVRHLCPHCACLITQSDYLAAAEAGVYVNETETIHLHTDGRFTTPEGEGVAAPQSVGIYVWTAYSPAVPWHQIVSDFVAAHEKMLEGDDSKMKAWTNTTRGLAWEGEIERTDADEFKARAEPFQLRTMPRDCLLLLCAIDTQDNRLEAGVWGLGKGGQMWTIDHRVFFGNPALEEVWAELEEFLRTQEYDHVCGIPQRIHASAIDSGGHHANAVYAFAHKLKQLRVHAIKGASARERSIQQGNSRVGFTLNGKTEKRGPVLWQVGTNLAKDRFHSRLTVSTPGPGYVHLSSELSDEWFKQLASEVRAVRRMQWGTESRWVPTRKRNEVKDILAYVIWLEERLDLWGPRRNRWWTDLEQLVQPDGDLFSTLTSAPPVDAPSAATAMQHPSVPRETRLQGEGAAPRKKRSGWVDANG